MMHGQANHRRSHAAGIGKIFRVGRRKAAIGGELTD